MNTKSNSVELNKDGIPLLSSMPESYRECRNSILSEYEKFDSPADQKQKLHISLGKLIFSTAFLAIFVVAIGVSFFETIPKYIFGIEFILLLIIMPLYIYAKRSAAHFKWIENRKQAEYLRILQFSILSGSLMRPQNSNDFCCQDKIEKMKEDLNTTSLENLKNYIRNNWFTHQLEYHTEKLKNFNRNENTLIGVTRILYTAAVLVAGMHLFGQFHSIDSLLILLSIVLPALCSALIAIKTLRDYKTIAVNSEKMIKEINELSYTLKDCTSHKDFYSIIQNAEIVFVNELERWHILISARDLELSL